MGKFEYELRYRRQELFDITQKPLIPFRVGGRDYLVYYNVNLSVFVSDECNASCNFCVARLRYFHEGVDYIKPAIADDEEYFSRLNEVISAVKPLNPSVSLTGGEPTISPRLPRILTILASHNVRKRTITTNGSGLLSIPHGQKKTILDLLIDYKLAHLNISRAHYDEKINQEIMKAKGGLSNENLEYVIRYALRYGVRPRLSCVLLKGYIDNFDEIIKYLDWAESLGADNVVFRQLMGFDSKAVKDGLVPRYCLEKEVALLPFLEIISRDSRFTFIKQVLGYYYYVEVWRYRNIDVVFETADLKLIDSEKEKSLKQTGGIPVIYELVFHPNGNLCGSWREWKEIIM